MTTTQYPDPIYFEDAELVPRGHRRQSDEWRAIIRAIYGTPLTPDERAIFLRLSGGVEPPTGGSRRVLIVAGRRSGKTSAAARIAWHESVNVAHGSHLEPGQIGSVSVVGSALASAQQTIDYVKGIAALGAFKKRVRDVKAESVELANGITISKVTASEQAARSKTSVCMILDEVAHFDHTGPDEDRKVIAALTPSLLVSGSAPPRRLIALTSAGYARGLAHEIFTRDYGRTGAPWLVIHASTLDLRPDLDPAEIEADCIGDPGKRAREYFSVWGDLSSSGYFSRDIIEACVSTAPAAHPRAGLVYRVALDPSFERDLFAVAVATSEAVLLPGDINQNRVRHTSIVHCEAWQPKPGAPISPEAAAARIAKICERYGSTIVYSDNHAAVPMREALAKHGIKLVKRSWHSGNTDDSKTARFGSVREMMHQRAFTIPNDPDLIRELLSIVHTPLQNGGIRIEGKGKNDDRAHAAVLAASEAIAARPLIADATLTPWEKSHKGSRERRLAEFIGSTGYSLF
jgi:hypothetical protein